jgi:very-short-patch-repair endonuclease
VALQEQGCVIPSKKRGGSEADGVCIKTMKIHYNPKLKEIAKRLRKNSTLSEVILWKHLKGKQMLGFDFHRQKPIDEYIVDFFCAKLKLIIEIDGRSHNYKVIHDQKRINRLKSIGLNILQFRDKDVKTNAEGVVLSIKQWIGEHTPKSPLDRGDF